MCSSTRALTARAGRRVNDLFGQLFDHAERYRRLHIGHGPSAWATAGHREILDACKAGDRDLSAGLLASHLARTGIEVSELLEPGYDPERLRRGVDRRRGRDSHPAQAPQALSAGPAAVAVAAEVTEPVAPGLSPRGR
jgi:hypothetical protein